MAYVRTSGCSTWRDSQDQLHTDIELVIKLERAEDRIESLEGDKKYLKTVRDDLQAIIVSLRADCEEDAKLRRLAGELARASLIASGRWVFSTAMSEQEHRQVIAKSEKWDKHKYRLEANIYSYQTRLEACRVRGVDPNTGRTR